MKKIKDKIYLFSPQIKYKTFKKIWDKFPAGSIVPMNFDKIAHQLLKEKKLYIYLDNENKDDDPISFSLKLPPNKIINIIK